MQVKNIAGIVTGAASGLGRATAKQLSKSGAKLVLFDLDEEGLKRAAAELQNESISIAVNVADPNAVENAVQRGVDKFCELRFAINCAGIPTSALTVSSNGKAHEFDIWKRVIDVNLTGTFNVIRFVAEHMTGLEAFEDNQRGVIINTSSIAAFDGQRGQAAYAASKAAIAGMSLPIARDLSNYGVRCMAIAPGLFETELLQNIPQKGLDALSRNLLCPDRMGAPSEFADLVNHIITNDYINGTVYRLDGGVRLS